MKINSIKKSFISIVEVENYNEIFLYDKKFWKDLLYQRKVLIFKKINFSAADYHMFGSLFGDVSFELFGQRINSEYKNNGQSFHKFSNLTHSYIGSSKMPWHADIPNHKEKPFPIRTLWMISNPNPNAGLTGFLNIEDSIEHLSDELTSFISRIKILQQDWFKYKNEQFVPEVNLQEFDFIKIHPITGKKSLRLNSYNIPNIINDAWISSVKIDSILQKDCKILEKYINEISKMEDMIYYHKWDNFDIIVYDNWPLVHCRTNLELEKNYERVLLRMNINHCQE